MYTILTFFVLACSLIHLELLKRKIADSKKKTTKCIQENLFEKAYKTGRMKTHSALFYAYLLLRDGRTEESESDKAGVLFLP